MFVHRDKVIAESVRLFIWQRDRGQCVKCGSQKRLEFDHIIPIAEGGSSTERNIQLLCETCNRSKGVTI
jgi:5-methylcytosine-specific restriction endonuclease McrA